MFGYHVVEPPIGAAKDYETKLLCCRVNGADLGVKGLSGVGGSAVGNMSQPFVLHSR